MQVLLDTCVPQDFRHALTGIDVVTARYAGLHQLSNGALLAAMAGKFDVLVTTDAQLRYQQNLTGYEVSVIVLRAKRNRLSDLFPLVPRLLEALRDAKSGGVIEIYAT